MAAIRRFIRLQDAATRTSSWCRSIRSSGAKDAEERGEIQDRLNEITFNAKLMRELRAIDFVDGLIDEGVLGQGQYRRVLVHRIDGTDALEDYNTASRLDARWRVFQRLRDKGRAAAQAWLAERYAEIGHTCTLDLPSAYQ